ncbi:nicotinate-nucleotide pyrophosphorylase [Thermoanaerobacterium thermosaccharolyticum DSM 571]|uniref:Probable nicotinate-nucleotide pyrophosphorylase [carboxylating] n=1 Tax=Thermoanaerobacterium thermosaccharolyticum (strain ATCC 7956 / DSM 571 / NCIMB 9385 / NCA 3814 / NCTC 13789 / WDCM 00135 / 2032) TaxID=580327 RepID=D9TSU5_THETC|nr:carboxylating nicotinate-nucleotide diphosphorylase [Thermoanaerobacterium thermosaccharolyticum]ADL68110.1 nicotinate-nucleotide pyrophosphorylase [Thermoanaerobacterium thermosaccharolyticum DSM 571]
MIDRLIAQRLIDSYLMEDLTWGDITTDILVPKGTKSKGYVYAKDDGIIAGIDVFLMVFNTIDSDIEYKKYFKDGEAVKKGDLILETYGDLNSCLKAERVALNLIQRMSGIATYVRKLSDMIKGTNARLTDTRKTMPGLRYFDKYAVSVGGGVNHRYNLSDGILIKDNHIKAVGGIKNALTMIKSGISHTKKVEIEVETIHELKEALKYGADIIMLDNMTIDMMKEAVEITNGRAILEASGNINEINILDVAKTGVDIISIGAITHSVKALDISYDL